jgi:hypothetical protein
MASIKSNRSKVVNSLMSSDERQGRSRRRDFKPMLYCIGRNCLPSESLACASASISYEFLLLDSVSSRENARQSKICTTQTPISPRGEGDRTARWQQCSRASAKKN